MMNLVRILAFAPLTALLAVSAHADHGANQRPADERGLFDYSLFAKNRIAVRRSDTINDKAFHTPGNVGVAGIQNEICRDRQTGREFSCPALSMSYYYVGGDLVVRGAVTSPGSRAPMQVRLSGIGGTLYSSEYVPGPRGGSWKPGSEAYFSGKGAFGRATGPLVVRTIRADDRKFNESLSRAALEMDRVSETLNALARTGRPGRRLPFSPFRDPQKCYVSHGVVATLPPGQRCEWTADLVFDGMSDPRTNAMHLNVYEVTAEELASAQNVLFRGSDKDVFVINVVGKTARHKENTAVDVDASILYAGFHLQSFDRTAPFARSPKPSQIIYNFVDSEKLLLSHGGQANDVALDWLGPFRYDTPGVGLPGTFLAARATVVARASTITGGLFGKTVLSDVPNDPIDRNYNSTQVNGDCFSPGSIPELAGVGCGNLPVPPSPGQR